MQPWRRALFFIAMLAGSGTLPRAAETWVQPERTSATPGARVMFELVTADEFDAQTAAVAAERVARVVARVAGAALPVGELHGTGSALQFEATLSRPGVAAVAVELKPRRLEISEEQIDAYFRMLRAGADVRAVWASLPAPRVWRELTTRSAKTFLRIGDPGPDERSWAEPLGGAVEIVPERDPTTLHAGDELSVRVQRGTTVVAGFALTFVSAGGAREHMRVSDSEGRARATLDLAGKWLVHGSELRRVASTDHDWESDFASMLVQVAP